MYDDRSGSRKAKPAPLITVAMPVYNAGRFLRQAVVSIVEQTFADWELIIIDDGSTDNAMAAVADINDDRIRIVSDGTNKGLAARLNEAIDLARGQYFARMDQDDISHPGRFMAQLAALEDDPQLDVVGTRAVKIDESGHEIAQFPFRKTHSEICARPWVGFYFPHPTWMGRIEWFRRHRYKLPQSYFCEDQELLLRSYGGSRFYCVPELLFAYRIHDGINYSKRIKSRWALCKIQLAHFRAHREFRYLALSFAAFLMRVGHDLLLLVKRYLVVRQGG